MRFFLIALLLISTHTFADEPIVVLPPETPLSTDLVIAPPPPPAPKVPKIVMSLSLLGKTGIQPVTNPLDVELTFKNEGDGTLEAAKLYIGARGATITSDFDEKLALKPNENKSMRFTLKAYQGTSNGTFIALVGLPNGTGFRQEFPLPFKDCTNRYAQRLSELEVTTRKPLLDKLYALRRADNSVTNTFHIAPNNDDREAARIINLVRNNYGVDPALYSTSALGDIAFRSIAEMKGYLIQGESPAVCTGAKEITSFYQERNALLTTRLELYARLKDKFYTTIKTQAPDFTVHLADFRDEAKRSEIFMQLREGKLPENIKSYVSSIIWLSEGEKRLLALDNGFKDLYAKIIEAQKEECVCGN